MTLQTIKSLDGKPEYVLLPMAVYKALEKFVERELERMDLANDSDSIAFDPAEYVDNPVALARLKAHVRQVELARMLGVSQAYISKIENQDKVSPKLLARVRQVLKKQK